MLAPLLLLATLAQQPVALVHARVIDGLGGAPIEDGTVVMVGDKISAVGPSASTRAPSGARVIDGKGLTALPGLTDMHVHLMGGWDGVTVDMVAYWRQLDALLLAGVTTVLDLGNSLPYVQQLKQEVAAGRLPGPRIFAAGPVIDGPYPVWPPLSFAVSADSQIALFVGQLVAGKFDVVKAYGGLTTPQIGLVATEAKKRGLKVFVDAWNRNGTLEVAQTGITSFAHLGRAPITDQTVGYMKANGVGSVTTLVVFETMTRRRLGDLRFLDQPLLSQSFPAPYREELTAFARRRLTGKDSAAARGAEERLKVGMNNAKRLFDAGVLLAAGTDAPYPGDYFGEGLHRELELLVEAGLTPLEAIGLATRNPAKLLGRTDWGTLEVGKRADLLLVRGDPSKRISDTKNVHTVIQAGKVVDRRALVQAIAGGPQIRPAGSTAK
jgi:imidazolonepropionase-like amidohydrolase